MSQIQTLHIIRGVPDLFVPLILESLAFGPASNMKTKHLFSHPFSSQKLGESSLTICTGYNLDPAKKATLSMTCHIFEPADKALQKDQAPNLPLNSRKCLAKL